MSERPPEPFASDPFDGEDLSAGEYALGVLDQHERRAAEARIAAEPAFARSVEAWEERLYPMADAIAAVAPPAHVWPRIVKALGAGPKVVDLTLRRATTFWRTWALASTAAAAVALVFLAVRSPAPTPTPPAAPTVQPLLVAALVDDHGRGYMTAAYDPNRGTLRTIPSLALPLGPDRAAELWLIAADGVPRSLGVVDAAHPTLVKVANPLQPGARADAVLAITAEQPGGSPSGKPTTKPRWIGKLTAV
jgi:anti-sigma-K factor RskA